MKSKLKKIKKGKEVVTNRRLIGIRVLGGGGKTIPQFYALYEVDFFVRQPDGTLLGDSRLERGATVGVQPSFEELNKKRPSKRDLLKFSLENRWDLIDNIDACAALLRGLEHAAMQLDEFYGKKTGRL